MDDIILSVNGHKYEDLIKSEGGISAWLKLFQAPVRELILLRPPKSVNNTGSVAPGVIKSYSALAGSASGKVQVAPLKDIGNTNTKVPVDVVKIPSSHDTKEHLLQLVASQWTTGKSSRQTSQCKAAIRNCLLADMRPFTIAKHVVKQVTPELQATEYERAKSCAQRIQQNMNKTSVPKAKTKPLAHDSNGEDDSDAYVPWSGAASIVDSSDEEYNVDDDDDDDGYESSDEEFETAIVDLEDVMKLGMPFQREGIIFKRGDKPPKRKAAILERGWEANITLSPVKED